MRHLPEIDLCATLASLFSTDAPALAETYAHFSDEAAHLVQTSRGASLDARFTHLHPTQVDTALWALRTYRARTHTSACLCAS